MISTDKIKNKIVCILVLCATIYMPVFGQAVPFKLWGKIMTKAGKPLVDVNIIIYFTNDLNNIAASSKGVVLSTFSTSLPFSCHC